MDWKYSVSTGRTCIIFEKVNCQNFIHCTDPVHRPGLKPQVKTLRRTSDLLEVWSYKCHIRQNSSKNLSQMSNVPHYFLAPYYYNNIKSMIIGTISNRSWAYHSMTLIDCFVQTVVQLQITNLQHEKLSKSCKIVQTKILHTHVSGCEINKGAS